MRDYGNGWAGLKDYAVKVGVANAGDTDDAIAAKVKAVIQGTLPEAEEPEAKEPEAPSLMERAASAVGLGNGDEPDSNTDTET